MTQLISLFQAGIVFGTVILYGAIGEILTEKSGNLNLGVPGIMYLGGIAGLMGVFFYEMNNPAPVPMVCVLIALGCAFLASVLGGLIYSVLTISLRANQNVTGLTLTIFAGGFANFFGGSLMKLAGGVGQINVATTSAAFRATLPFVQELPALPRMLLGFGFMVYLAVVVAFLVSWFLNRSSVGLNLRAVGENPATADAAGINVAAYKYISTVIGGGISAIGGMVYITTIAGCVWNHEGLSGVGWLAVALVIFCMWRPLTAIWGSVLFGALMILYLRLTIPFIPTQLYKILPYVVTVIVLIVSSMRNNKEKQPPAALGLPYFREER